MTHHLPFISRPKWLILLTILLIYTNLEAQSIQQWYDNAQARIDTLRRGSFGIEIYDKDGQPYSGPVKVRMMKHEFPFGIAFDFYEGDIQTDVPTETQWMKAAMYKYFNYGVSGNSFKWSGIDPNGNGPNYTNFEHALSWTQKVGWELRAHTLLWGGSEGDNHAMPQWVTGLGTAEAVFEECEKRVRREVSRYKGLVKEYDVINEPLHATYTQELYGDSLNWKCFEWAYNEDPDAKFFVNDYNVEYGWGDADEYKSLIEKLIAKGAPVTGIGIQAHFWDCCRPDVTDFVTQINKLAGIGLPIRLTEYDYGGNLTEEQQAEDFIKVMTIAFSHPSINGMISWALSDLGAWRENTGYFTADHRPKLAADTLMYLTQKLWATNFESTVEGETLHFDAYYGDYIIEIPFGEEVKQFSIPLTKVNEDSIFQLYEDEATMKEPELVQALLSSLDKLELTFDEPLDPVTINKYDFRVFASNGVAIEDISVRAEDDRILDLSLDQHISIMDYATVSYFPGSLKGTNGASARAFGTEHIKINVDLNKAPEAEDQVFEMSESAAGGTEIGQVQASDPEGSQLEYTITAGNHLGIFSIGKNTGVITLRNPFLLDYEETPSYMLTVDVTDGIHTIALTVTIHLVRVLRSASPQPEVSVFPNPASRVIDITSSVPFSNLRLHDLSGRLLIEKKLPFDAFKTSMTLDLRSGLYLLELSGKGHQMVKRIMVSADAQ